DVYKRQPWGCSGNLEQEAVRRLVEEHRVQVRSCYERQLRQNPMLQGSVNVLVRVESQGTVGDMQLDGSLRDREVLSCMRTIISRIRFPPVTGGNCAIVRIPFSFTPQQ
ncbi:MAG: AgmX/PglI C-terminal domain-containing protein, partial [Deltaproteobacteria bacterium]|nr:AgmX/PglI C-terminal domain-containing protein [Deltaproteobacteria bacterium]